VRIRSADDGSVPVLTGDVLCTGDNSYAETLANQITVLVEEESDAERLACYRGDVHRLATQFVNASKLKRIGRIGTMLADYLHRQRLDERRN
jgi:hypothetical protein